MADMRLPFPIRPGVDTGASHYAKYGVGGYYALDTEEEKAGIPAERLETGLEVYVRESGKLWRYDGPETWTELNYADATVVSEMQEELRKLTNWDEYE